MSAPRYALAVALDGHRVLDLRGLTPREAVLWRRTAREAFRFDGAEVTTATVCARVVERWSGRAWMRRGDAR